jgi:L-fuculose-phosphate aldolase
MDWAVERAVMHPRDQITRTMERIYRYRMTTTSGGNLSVRDDNGDVWISPARIDKGNLTRNDIVGVGADGTVQGLHRPSSEYPFHRAIYEVRPDVRAIVHAHPVALVAFSIGRNIPDTRIFHQANFVCGEVGFAPYGLPGSEALARSIADTFAQGNDSVILENHGVVVGGSTLSHAFQRFEAFEFAAKTIIKARQLCNADLSEIRYLSQRQLAQAQNRKVEVSSVSPPPASSQEKELRVQLRDFLRRGCRQRLLISTEGSFSARVGGNDFLITPSQQDREQIEIADLVLVQGSSIEAGKRPSRATGAHRAIYQRHPEVNAIVFAHPVNATAFSITDSSLDTRTIPESYLFLRDVQRVPFGIQHANDDRIAEYVSPRQPAAILENDGVLVTGSTVLDAFDRLEVLEATAEAVINARALGPVASMPDGVIAELRSAFKID